MNQKVFKKIVLSILSFIFIVLILTLIKLNFIDKPRDVRYNNIKEQEYFIAKKYQDKIALFTNTSNQPIQVLDVYFSILSEHDKKHLEDGIVLKTEKEVKKFIEDFNS